MRKTCSALIAIALLLISLGIVMLASASGVRGQAAFGDPAYFLYRQLVWGVLALLVGGALTRSDYHWWQRLALVMLLVSITLLIAVRIPGIGSKINGSYRWIRLGPLSLQPSEFAKLATLISLAAWYAKVGRRPERFVEGFLIPGIGLGLTAMLVIVEPDFGTSVLIAAAGGAVMFAAGVRLSYLSVSGVAGLSLVALAVMRDSERMGRIMAFLMPEQHPEEAYHLQQSLIAFVNGGVFGVGLGNSMQKQFYLPEAHTDFILAVIGEELGFLATGSVVLLFVALLVLGLSVSLRAPDPFGKLLSFGLTMLLTLQAAINVGVVTGCLPTKGLALPFISYGGSSLVTSAACMGILLNIGLQSGGSARSRGTRPIKDRAHRF